MQIPEFKDVLHARKRISPFLPRTPFQSYPGINELLGTTTFIKHEDCQPTGAFKVRGGINLVAQLSESERQRGVIAASTGNHGQSVAYAAQLFGAQCTIVVPEKANPGKVTSIKSLGAEVIFYGERFDDSRIHAEELASQHGFRYVHSGDEPHLIAGVATATLELLEDQPDIEIIIVPIGGGSGAAGACLAAEAIDPSIKVIGVQSEESPAAFKSWQTREITTAPNRTEAEGLATGVAFELPQRIIQSRLKDFLLVSDADIRKAVVWMIEHAQTLAENAGAAALAGAFKIRAQLEGKKVALICSGGNMSLELLRLALAV